MKYGNALFQELTRQDEEWKAQRLSVEDTKKELVKRATKNSKLVSSILELEVGESIRFNRSQWPYKRPDGYMVNRVMKDRGLPLRITFRDLGEECLVIRKQ